MKGRRLSAVLVVAGVLLAAFGIFSLVMTGPSSGTGASDQVWMDVLPGVFLIVAGFYLAYIGGRRLSR